MSDRYVIFPIKYHQIYEHYQNQVANFWTPEEICFQQDLVDWPMLTEDQRYFIKMVLAFFAASDGIVGENLAMRFYNDTTIPEARAAYAFQLAMETCHSITYSLLIDTYISDNKEKDYLFNAIETIPAVKKKAEWALKWIESDLPYLNRLLAFVCVEGIQFSGSFCAIYYIKSLNKMPGLCFQNELVSRDEGSHTDFGIDMYKLTIANGEKRIAEEEVHAMFKEAVDIEDEFINESLPCSLLGMSSSLMSEYIRYCADRLLIQLGYEKLYNAEQPFDFMEHISLPRKTSFFEAKVSEYRKSGVGDSSSGQGLANVDFNDEDFD
ncbi:ribonucleoside-diphosphate reductase subunit beta [Tetraselmis virus 1]|uniref:ribonucleoside-diphosphate reductase n=1 Tax=Tetraselmis virus 1 TaxID=2060617 RepID=A0A2P0VNY9_9VIRU|nr:ribonucleoside-diphosphate reductase subunit beta [Tetraselmis virus 1]AUF82615.1 ribonucleoside-diphosphate reductase subunit beta [Tetraselmis virus 1]